MFSEDLEIGKQKEKEVMLWLRQYFNAELSEGYDKDKDIIINGLIEVKFDRLATQTGNIAIELLYNSKPSGLSSTKSKSWVICTYEGCWWCPTETLKFWVKEYCKKDGKWNLVKGGDNNLSGLALIDYKLIKNFIKII